MRCAIRLFAGYTKPGQAKGQFCCLRVKLSAMSFIYMKDSEKGEPDYEPCKYFFDFWNSSHHDLLYRAVYSRLSKNGEADCLAAILMGRNRHRWFHRLLRILCQCAYNPCILLPAICGCAAHPFAACFYFADGLLRIELLYLYFSNDTKISSGIASEKCKDDRNRYAHCSGSPFDLRILHSMKQPLERYLSGLWPCRPF